MIILSIPYLHKKHVKNALNKYSSYEDLIEFRLDYLHNLNEIDNSLINSKTILTIRDINEGGINHFDKIEKLTFFNDSQKKFNCWVDYELYDYHDNIHNETKLILSYHQNDNEDLSLDRILMEADKHNFSILKIVKNENNWHTFLEHCRILADYNKPVIYIAQGFFSMISRILYKHLGFIGTYVGCPSYLTAQGQMDLEEAKRYNLDVIDETYILGGLIGGKQVYQSRGLIHYNNYFRENNYPAIYLPLCLDKPEDILELLKYKQFKFYGFSLTMPHKKTIPALLDFHRISNLYILENGSFFNTDSIALNKAIEYLKIPKGTNVLIIGSGATATMAIETLQDNFNISLYSRNSFQASRLSLKYKLINLQLADLEKRNFTVLINCTPIGMNFENLMDTYPIKKPEYVIDLPYSNDNTPLIQYCKNNNIPYVDGNKFWLWQSENQMEMFLEIIERYISTEM